MPPLSIMVKPASGLCNMRCKYCFYNDVTSSRDTRSYGLMSIETLDKLVRRACIYAEGSVHLTFQGGEPTLAGVDFFRTLLELEKKYNSRRLPVFHALQTNGYALGPEWLPVLKAGGFLVGISLDGSEALHDANRIDAQGQPTYNRILRTIGMLKENDIPYNILTVVHEEIACHPDEVWQALSGHGYLQFIPCLDALDGSKTQYSLKPESYGRFLTGIFDHYEKAWYTGKPVSERVLDNWIGMLMGHAPENCAMGGRCGIYYLIEADGSVYPCDFYALDEWCVGNINRQSFSLLSKSELAGRFRAGSVQLADKCHTCRWYGLCRGGCRRDREPVGGEAQLFRLCEGYRSFFEARYERMTALAKYIADLNRRG